jgi:hypothetical protein
MLKKALVVLACSVLGVSSMEEKESNRASASGLRVEMVSGADMQPYLERIVEYRLKYFKEFPYLYQGNVEEEVEFVEQYIKSSTARVLVLKDQCGNFGGFATGISVMESSHADKLGVIINQPENVYYIGEMIFDELFRGKDGFRQCLSYFQNIKEMGYKKVCFITVQRDGKYPRPINYHDHEGAWGVTGFEKYEQTITISWPVIQVGGDSVAQENILNIWIKKLM